MDIFSFSGALPWLLIFAFTAYAVLVFGVASLRLIANTSSRVERSELAFQPHQSRLSGKVAVAFSSGALISEVILVAAKALPEKFFIWVFLVLFPLLILSAIIGVVAGSIKLVSGFKLWDYIGVALGMTALILVSVWLLAPVIFPP